MGAWGSSFRRGTVLWVGVQVADCQVSLYIWQPLLYLGGNLRERFAYLFLAHMAMEVRHRVATPESQVWFDFRVDVFKHTVYCLSRWSFAVGAPSIAVVILII